MAIKRPNCQREKIWLYSTTFDLTFLFQSDPRISAFSFEKWRSRTAGTERFGYGSSSNVAANRIRADSPEIYGPSYSSSAAESGVAGSRRVVDKQ